MPHDNFNAEGEPASPDGACRATPILRRWWIHLRKYLAEAITTLARAHVIELEASKPQERDEGR